MPEGGRLSAESDEGWWKAVGASLLKVAGWPAVALVLTSLRVPTAVSELRAACQMRRVPDRPQMCWLLQYPEGGGGGQGHRTRHRGPPSATRPRATGQEKQAPDRQPAVNSASRRGKRVVSSKHQLGRGFRGNSPLKQDSAGPAAAKRPYVIIQGTEGPCGYP